MSSVETKQAESALRSEFPFHELAQLQGHLDELRAKLWDNPHSGRSDQTDEVVLQRLAREIIRSRRKREKVFGEDLFGEPAWDILLELCVAEWTQQKLSVSGACFASSVPPTTALRWVQRLEKEGWVKRVSDRLDGRRFWLAPTETASVAMRNFLNDIAIRPV
jgi:DNA-binding MarR family transcriptional regulator